VRRTRVNTPEQLGTVISQVAGQDADHPNIRRTALAVVGRYPEKDWPQLLRDFVLRATRWIPERGEVVEGPAEVLRLGAADCDGLTTLYLALAWSVGINARPMLVGDDEAAGPVHVLPEVETEDGWRAVEVSHPQGREWQFAWRNALEDTMPKQRGVSGLAVGAGSTRTVRCWQPPNYDTYRELRTRAEHPCPCPEIEQIGSRDPNVELGPIDDYDRRRTERRCGPLEAPQADHGYRGVGPGPGDVEFGGVKKLNGGAVGPGGGSPGGVRLKQRKLEELTGARAGDCVPGMLAGPLTPAACPVDPVTGRICDADAGSPGYDFACIARAVEAAEQKAGITPMRYCPEDMRWCGAAFCSTPDGTEVVELDVPGEGCECPNVYVEARRAPQPWELRVNARRCGAWIPEREVYDPFGPDEKEVPEPPMSEDPIPECEPGYHWSRDSRSCIASDERKKAGFPWWLLILAYYVSQRK